MPTLKLRVTRLCGGADEERVRRALHAESGVFGAVVCAAESCAEVDFEDDEVSADEILAVVRRLGFDAELAG
jgi:copper chaperone CopZ